MSQSFRLISLERGLGKGMTCSCVTKRAQVGSCPLDLSSIQVSGFNLSYLNGFRELQLSAAFLFLEAAFRVLDRGED